MHIESLRILLGHRTLAMTQLYARLHNETIRQQFELATAHLEAIPIPDWPVEQPVSSELDLEQLARSELDLEPTHCNSVL